MMHARHLVRRLLELRSSSGLSFDVGLNASQSGGGEAQTTNHAQFGSNPNIAYGNSQAEVDHTVSDAQLGVEVGINNVHGQRFDDLKGQVANQHGLGQSFSFGQSGLPQQKFDLGQQGDLSGQSINTVSGFWVPFKRPTKPSQATEAA